MKFHIIFVGKTSEKYLDTGVSEYIKRLAHYVPASIEIVKASAIKDADKAMHEEERNIVSKLLPGDYLVVLDEKGIEINSRQFSEIIQKWMQQGKNRIVFITGGAFGINPSLKSKADYKLSLSKFTFTHQMVRLFLAEQLYRAMTIARNEKYHHD